MQRALPSPSHPELDQPLKEHFEGGGSPVLAASCSILDREKQANDRPFILLLHTAPSSVRAKINLDYRVLFEAINLRGLINNIMRTP